jgi:hypothetical protein
LQGLQGPTGPGATNGVDGTTGPTGAAGISAAGINFNQSITLTDNTVLTSAQTGCLLYCAASSGSYTLTLPAATTMVAGSGFTFSVTTNTTWTFVTTGTDSLDSYFPLNQNDRYSVVSNAIDGWHEIYRTNDAISLLTSTTQTASSVLAGPTIGSAPAAWRQLNTTDILQPVSVITDTGDVTLTATDYIVVLAKTVGASTAVTLPTTPAAGQIVIIKDGNGDAATNNITIGGGTIDGAASFVIADAYAAVTLVYNGVTGWSII